MTTASSNIKAYWESRSPRDRRIIVIIGSLIGISLMYAYVWLPMDQTRTRLRSELPKLRGAAAQMTVQAQEAARLKSKPASASRGDPQALINQSAEQAGIKDDVSQVTALSAERIQVTLNKVAFDNWVRWTQSLAAQTGLRIESANVTAGGEPGMVKVQAVLAVPR